MCGRYTVFVNEAFEQMRWIVEEAAGKTSETLSTGEIFPTNLAPVLALRSDRMTPIPAKWGFPRWNGGGAVINARAETALEKRMFRKSLLQRRCIVPSTGFFEWKRIDGKKQKEKFWLRTGTGSMLYMAGAMNVFMDAFGTPRESFVILTTQANAWVAPLHDRMPVILSQDELEAWLRDDGFMELVLHRIGPSLSLSRA